jgi:hypothetical protein
MMRDSGGLFQSLKVFRKNSLNRDQFATKDKLAVDRVRRDLLNVVLPVLDILVAEARQRAAD